MTVAHPQGWLPVAAAWHEIVSQVRGGLRRGHWHLDAGLIGHVHADQRQAPGVLAAQRMQMLRGVRVAAGGHDAATKDGRERVALLVKHKEHRYIRRDCLN